MPGTPQLRGAWLKYDTCCHPPSPQALEIYQVLTHMHGMSAKTKIGLPRGASHIKLMFPTATPHSKTSQLMDGSVCMIKHASYLDLELQWPMIHSLPGNIGNAQHNLLRKSCTPWFSRGAIGSKHMSGKSFPQTRAAAAPSPR